MFHGSSSIPLGRLGRSEEVAKVVLFRASEDSGYVAGVELFVTVVWDKYRLPRDTLNRRSLACLNALRKVARVLLP
jgi:hypothetical protein